MISRFAFAALISGFVFLSTGIAVANIGDTKDVNKDGLIDETDADIVILHVDEWGVTDALEDALDKFGTWDDEDIPYEDIVTDGSAEPSLYRVNYLRLLGLTSGDEARINYVVTWERKDVNNDGDITAADALVIINYLNSN
jgi:hypothetical protein